MITWEEFLKTPWNHIYSDYVAVLSLKRKEQSEIDSMLSKFKIR